MKQSRFAWIVPAIYILFLLTPIYWLVAMSFKTNVEITTRFTLLPETFNLDNYVKVFTDQKWRDVFANSIIYVGLNTIISVAVALPAAYAFSRYKFFGDKHLFFWLLTNRMAPAAVFTLPFFQLYSAFGLFDTHIAVALAHCLFNVPLAVWILEGFMSRRPARDRRDRLYRRPLLPELLREDLHAADRQRHRRRGVLLLHVLVGRIPDRGFAGPLHRHADHHAPAGARHRHPAQTGASSRRRAR